MVKGTGGPTFQHFPDQPPPRTTSTSFNPDPLDTETSDHAPPTPHCSLTPPTLGACFHFAMSDQSAVPNGHAATATESPSPELPPEIEATLSRLSAYRNVRGVMIISRSTSAGVAAGVVQSTGSVFQGESGRKYAKVVENLAASVGAAVGEVDEGVRLSRFTNPWKYLPSWIRHHAPCALIARCSSD
jgi:dynein light chain roadblock-type